jgi:hypothetical protein
MLQAHAAVRRALLVGRRLAAATACSRASRPPPVLEKASRLLGKFCPPSPSFSAKERSAPSTRRRCSACEDGHRRAADAARGLPRHWSRQVGLWESALLHRGPPPSYAIRGKRKN